MTPRDPVKHLLDLGRLAEIDLDELGAALIPRRAAVEVDDGPPARDQQLGTGAPDATARSGDDDALTHGAGAHSRNSWMYGS